MVWFSFGLHTLKKLSKGALWGINWRQLPLPLDNLLHLSSGKISTFQTFVFTKHFWWNFFTVIGLEDDVVGLRVAHDEDQIDDEESKKIFGDHPIDHDHKGADNLECPSEKTLVAMRMQEIWKIGLNHDDSDDPGERLKMTCKRRESMWWWRRRSLRPGCPESSYGWGNGYLRNTLELFIFKENRKKI